MRSFGTDGEKTLIDAFLHEFHFETHLFCCFHVRRNVKDELRRQRLPEDVANEITDEIFGKKTYVEGLVDAEDSSSFYKKLDELEGGWQKKGKCWM